MESGSGRDCWQTGVNPATLFYGDKINRIKTRLMMMNNATPFPCFSFSSVIASMTLFKTSSFSLSVISLIFGASKRVQTNCMCFIKPCAISKKILILMASYCFVAILIYTYNYKDIKIKRFKIRAINIFSNF